MDINRFSKEINCTDDFTSMKEKCIDTLKSTKYYKGNVNIHFEIDYVEFWFTADFNPRPSDIIVFSYKQMLDLITYRPR